MVLSTGGGDPVEPLLAPQEASVSDRLEFATVLLDSLAHDLRNSLTSVIGMASILRTHESDLAPLDRERLLDRLLANAVAMDRLISELFDLRRADAGFLLQMRDVDVGDVARDVAERIDDPEHPIELRVGPLRARLDAFVLDRILWNLMTNATRHTPAGTPITVRARRVRAGIAISVDDLGPGVPVEARESIFERFRRGPTSAKGTGLGLFLVARLAELHGGTAWVQPGAKRGASFRVFLPDG